MGGPDRPQDHALAPFLEPDCGGVKWPSGRKNRRLQIALERRRGLP